MHVRNERVTTTFGCRTKFLLRKISRASFITKTKFGRSAYLTKYFHVAYFLRCSHQSSLEFSQRNGACLCTLLKFRSTMDLTVEQFKQSEKRSQAAILNANICSVNWLLLLLPSGNILPVFPFFGQSYSCTS